MDVIDKPLWESIRKGNKKLASELIKFTIKERLKKVLDIPVFHGDQHGTAVIS
ncbi:MAG: hypothetical protein PHS04_06690 [Tissierellia bacterium]|jgi:hypothetical protein|nr:hypothetical protein [Tissierellia bacterium]